MRILVLTANNELRISRKSHLRDHPTSDQPANPYDMPQSPYGKLR
jgi:hypothetical protein